MSGNEVNQGSPGGAFSGGTTRATTSSARTPTTSGAATVAPGGAFSVSSRNTSSDITTRTVTTGRVAQGAPGSSFGSDAVAADRPVQLASSDTAGEANQNSPGGSFGDTGFLVTALLPRDSGTTTPPTDRTGTGITYVDSLPTTAMVEDIVITNGDFRTYARGVNAWIQIAGQESIQIRNAQTQTNDLATNMIFDNDYEQIPTYFQGGGEYVQ